jgi:hypothetical protein
MEDPKDATALDVATAISVPAFARASRDIMETGASTRQFSAKETYLLLRSILGDEVGLAFINDKLILYEIRIVTFLRLMSLPYE